MSDVVNYTADLSRGFSYQNRNWPSAYPATQGQYDSVSNRFYGYISFSDIIPHLRNRHTLRYRLASATMTVRRSGGSWGSSRTLHIYGSKISPSLPTGTIAEVFTNNRITSLYDVPIPGVSSAGAAATVTLPLALVQALIDTTSATGVQLECDTSTDYMLLGSYGAATENLPYLTITWYKLPTVTSGGDKSGSEGDSVVFSVSASGGDPDVYSYQWQISTNGGASWMHVTDATSATLPVSGLARGMNTYKYRCIVSNAAGSVISNPMTLTVFWKPTLNPALPADTEATTGTQVTLQSGINAAGNPANYSYQWYKNGSALSGETGSSCTVTVAAGDNGYCCRVTNSAGMVQTRTATVTGSGTLRLKVNGEWKQATPYIKAGGEWKQATPYINVNGVWMPGQ